ncbi:MAG: hypothetical protein ACLR8Y_19765 [Alistipes indistinctus]
MESRSISQPRDYPAESELPEYATLETLYMEQSPELQRLADEHSVNLKTITLNKALALPKFEVGYRHNYGLEGRLPTVYSSACRSQCSKIKIR